MEFSAVSRSKTIDEERSQLLRCNPYIVANDEKYSLRKLFATEDIIGFERTESFVCSDDRHRYTRSRAIKWILKTKDILGFQSQTAYLAVMYFDRYVSRKAIDNEDLCSVQLLSMACLSAAASWKESKYVPISEYPQGDCNLGNEMRTRMERLVGNTLEWKLHLITPFDFLPFFIKEIPNKSSSASSHLLSDVIITTMKDINLMEIRPSTVAFAAILRVTDQSLTTRTAFQISMRTVSFSEYLAMEDVFECYNLMLQYRLDTDVGCFWKCFSSCFPFRLWRRY